MARINKTESGVEAPAAPKLPTKGFVVVGILEEVDWGRVVGGGVVGGGVDKGQVGSRITPHVL